MSSYITLSGPAGRSYRDFWSDERRCIVAHSVKALPGKLRGVSKPSRGPVQLYLSLVNWGALSGMPLIPSETPREYGRRLIKRLPAVTDEIELIISVHNASIYGERTGQTAELHHALAACTRLRSPRFWPVRLKSLLFR